MNVSNVENAAEARAGSSSTMFVREFAFERAAAPPSAQGEERSVEISFSSEDPVRRYDWWEDRYYNEILSHADNAIRLDRLTELGVALFNHDTDRIVGRLESVELDTADKKCKCRIVFDEDNESETIYQKVRSGTLKGVSVGYRVYSWEKVEKDVTTSDGIKGPAMVARDWEPLEVSVVSVPADVTVGVGRSADILETREEKSNMEQETNATAAVETNSTTTAVQRDEQAEERARCSEITRICREFDMDPTEYIEAGRSVEEVQRSVLAALSAERAAVSTSGSAGAVQINRDERESYRSAVTDGLRMRCGRVVEKPAAGAEDFRGIRLLDLARDILERSGERIGFGASQMEVAGRAFGTSDFPIILGNLASAVLSDSYEAAPTTWGAWCATGSLSDFKEQTIVKLSETDELELVPELGEYKYASLAESKDSIRLYTYGKLFGLSRQAIINDDLRAFTRLPQKFGAAAARTINKAVYAPIAGNTAVMAETKKVLFHADHHNIGTAKPISTESINEARTAMRRQKGLKGKEFLNLYPSFIIVPPEQETIARKVLESGADLSETNPAAINPFRNSLTIICDAELTEANHWYLAAASSLVDTVEVAFLDGQNTPLIEQENGWKVDALEWKIRLDFGVKVWDYRGLFMNAGA